MTSALLIVDVQYDFLPGGALAVKDGNSIIPIINQLSTYFDLIITSQDWHPKDHISFATTHGKKVGEAIDINGKKQELWPVHCVQHTHGAALSKELNIERADKHIYKGTSPEKDVYSAFEGTSLDDYLQEKRAEKLYIAGLTTDFCVKFTVLDALKLGYEVIVIKDACRGVFDEEKALEAMKQAGAKILTSRDIESQLVYCDSSHLSK